MPGYDPNIRDYEYSNPLNVQYQPPDYMTNRINAMKLREMNQQMRASDAYLYAKNNPQPNRFVGALQGGQPLAPQGMQPGQPQPLMGPASPSGVTPTPQPLAPQNAMRQNQAGPQGGPVMPPMQPGQSVGQAGQQPQISPDQGMIRKGMQFLKDFIPVSKNAFDSTVNNPENGNMINAMNEQLQGTAPQLALASLGMYDTEIGHDDKTQQMWYRTTKYFTQADLDKMQQSNIPGIKAYANVPPGLYRVDTDPADNYRIRSMEPVSSLLGKKTDQELIDIAQDENTPADIRAKAKADFDAMQRRATLSDKQLSPDARLVRGSLREQLGREPTMTEVLDEAQRRKVSTTAAQGAARYQYLRDNQQYQTIDALQGNKPVWVMGKDLKKDEESGTNRYGPIAATEKALTRTALIEDIRGNITNTADAIDNLKTGFSPAVRGQLALVMRDRNPKSAADTFLGSQWGTSLTPDQQDYVAAIANLQENAMAMRSVLGAGQGSEDLRAAILRTIPGPGTPNKEYAKKQLALFNKTLDRLSRGIPKVQLRQEQKVAPTEKVEPRQPGETIADYLKRVGSNEQ